MTAITHTGHAFPQWSRRTSALIVGALALAATVAIVLLTVVTTSSGSSHSTAPGVVHVQKPGVAGQTGSNQCQQYSKLAPTRC